MTIYYLFYLLIEFLEQKKIYRTPHKYKQHSCYGRTFVNLVKNLDKKGII